jgi:glutamate formiminotransferase
MPDFGPAKLHPTAGATVVGARMPLIAYNVNLKTDDIGIAKSIAKKVRFSSGGLKYVKALGLEIKERGIVQVSMNLTNFKETPVYRVFDLIKSEAKEYGVEILGSEIVGLIPMDALVDSADFYLQIENFDKSQILENKLRE